MSLRLDAEQRFTCQQCGRCCRRGWDIAVTSGELDLYRKAHVERLYREREDAAEGTERDPFEPIPAREGFARIRKRTDGACGFLSPENRCRIHEELGADRKPLTCRLFPFRFHPADGPPVVSASFCCPTVVANGGATLASQAKNLGRLEKEWRRTYPEPETPLELVAGHPLPPGALGTLRSILREMLDRPGGEGGAADLRANVGRMAGVVADLGRLRVLRLAPDRLVEYLELTGRHAARADKPLALPQPSRLARFLFRGFLYAVAAAHVQMADGRTSGLRLGLRLRLLRLLLHFHGLWPATAGYDLAAARRARVDLDPAVAGLVRNYLRATIETLGTGRRPLLEELCVAVAFLNAAQVLATMRAARAGAAVVDEATFATGLMEAVDLTHAPSEGALHRTLGSLAGSAESLYLFAGGGPLADQ